MHKLFQGIKSIGFDLDQTLYPKNNDMDNLIRDVITKKILGRNPELGDINNVLSFYNEEYKKIGSRTQILRNLGYGDAEEIMYSSLNNPKILDLLKEDIKLIDILKRVKREYVTFLITASPKDISIKKLNKMGINLELFDLAVFGDTPNAGTKINGSIFRYFLNKSKYPPEQHVYIGDSLNSDIMPTKILGIKTIAVGENIPEADFSIEKIYDLESLLL